MGKKILLICVAICIFLSAFNCINVGAAPVWDRPYRVEQPDGEVLELLINGDEYFNYVNDKNGYLVKKNEETGYYVYVTISGHEVITGDNIVTNEAIDNFKDADRITAIDYFAAQKEDWVEYPMDFTNKEFKFSIMGNEVDFGDKTPQVVDGSTMVPLRLIMDERIRNSSYHFTENEYLMFWNSDTKAVHIRYFDNTIIINTTNNIAYINGKEYKLGTSPYNSNGTVYVPVRFAAEILHLDFERYIKWGQVYIDLR